MSNKQGGRKERNEFVGCILDAHDGQLEITVDPTSGRFNIKGGKCCYSERSYSRPGKPKFLSRVPACGDGCYFDSFRTIQENYDVLAAIDTNTREVQNSRISVTGIYVAQPVWAVAPSTPPDRQWQFFHFGSIVFSNLSNPRERAGWSAALQWLESRGVISRSSRVGIVVDAHLSDHAQINKRRDTIDGYNYLPRRWSLIYATSDGGKEDFVNRLVGYADRVSSQVLAEFESGNQPMPDSSTGQKNFHEGVLFVHSKSGALR